MHRFKYLALASVLGLAVASAAWLLSQDAGREPSGPTPPPKTPVRKAEADVTPRLPAADVDQEPAALPEPPPEPTPESSSRPSRQPPPAADPAEDLYPEHLDIAEATWNDVLVTEILRDVASRGNFVIRMPSSIEKLLEGERMNLDVTNTTAAMVIARVLQPHNLTYTAREGVVRVITDPGD